MKESVELLEEIDNTMLPFLKIILKKLNIKEDLFDKKVPLTFGKIDTIILEEYLYQSFGPSYDLIKKQNKRWSVNINPTTNKRMSGLISGASINTIKKQFANSTGQLAAIIQGGRIFNERWEEYTLEDVLDIDIKACYATIMEDMDYPIGLPTILAFSKKKSARPTLREFLSKNKKELVENLYTIVVSGKLSYSQTLLYSKVKESDIREDCDQKMIMLSNELKNTIITSSILESLQKICTPNELNEIMDAKVETAIYYPKSLELPAEEFVKEISKIPTTGTSEFDESISQIRDIRPRLWTKVSLGKLIKPLKKIRQEAKEENNKALDQIAKLLINTIYGILISVHFEISNVVVGNNITAQARLEIWKSNKKYPSVPPLNSLLFLDYHKRYNFVLKFTFQCI